ncbi:MAG: hypothetical protein PHF86_02510 [Candidatus Nanoarchaeia archaeon]|jgi:hypothetical protein|nr:hypothetical protein [Candidatus Nanoarchaeia archaeon]
MSEIKMSRLDLSIVFIEDKDGGYTAYFLEYPEIIVEGDNKNDAVKNLFATFYDILEKGAIKIIK